MLYLENDMATSWMGGALGSFRILQNSQCSVTLAGTSVSLNGNTLTLRLPISFTAAYSGSWVKTYMSATDVVGASTGWQVRGTWDIP